MAEQTARPSVQASSPQTMRRQLDILREINAPESAIRIAESTLRAVEERTASQGQQSGHTRY